MLIQGQPTRNLRSRWLPVLHSQLRHQSARPSRLRLVDWSVSARRQIPRLSNGTLTQNGPDLASITSPERSERRMTNSGPRVSQSVQSVSQPRKEL